MRNYDLPSELEKVLIVTPHYPPNRLGGTQTLAQGLAHWLLTQGVSAEVICVEEVEEGPDGEFTVLEDIYQDIPVHRLSLRRTQSPLAFRYSYDHEGVAAYIKSVARERDVDLIHLISGYLVTANAIRVAHTLDIPAVVSITDHWFICPRINLTRSDGSMCDGATDALECTRCLLGESRRYRLPEQLAPGLMDRLWRAAAKLGKRRIPLWHEMARRRRRLTGLLNEADARIVPTNSLRPRLARQGVRDDFYLCRQSVQPAALGIHATKSESQGLRFGYLGNLLPIKGVDLLISAFQRLAAHHNGASLAVWGASLDPSYEQRLHRMARNTPSVTLHGPYETDQIGALLADIDVLVVPSLCPETGPFVLLEAFAAKTPVIVANIGNMPELVTHNRDGLLFTPGSEEELYEQMRRLLEEPALYEQLRAQVPPVQTPEDEMADIAAVYAQVCAKVWLRRVEYAA